ncbi:hypothetical protein ACOMHN_039901 [Nucella lapillus]
MLWGLSTGEQVPSRKSKFWSPWRNVDKKQLFAFTQGAVRISTEESYNRGAPSLSAVFLAHGRGVCGSPRIISRIATVGIRRPVTITIRKPPHAPARKGDNPPGQFSQT